MQSAKNNLVTHMKNIKMEIAAYKEAVRHLWNTRFSVLNESLRFGVCLELFENIDDLLFRSLVCEPLGIKFQPKASFDPIMNLKVVSVSCNELPIMINRSTLASGYWDYPVKAIKTSGVEFILIGFFDWDPYGEKDLRYYRVRIVGCSFDPDLNGRDALIETCYADVFLEE